MARKSGGFVIGSGYWFRPKRFWHWFAAYYPASREGWAITLGAALLLVYVFGRVSERSSSAGDTLSEFIPALLAVLIVWDLITIHTGEYPKWWKKT